MLERFELDMDKSVVSIVQRYGDSAPDMIAVEAVERLKAHDFDGYVALKQILNDIEEFLAERRSAEAHGVSQLLPNGRIDRAPRAPGSLDAAAT